MPKVVQMGEIGVSFANQLSISDEEKPLLTTKGISTCIAIILHGRARGRDFCAMYHWPGLPEHIKNNASLEAFPEIYNVFINIEESIRKKFRITSDASIEIKAITIIGGEKQQITAHGELEISGTEQEVHLLKTYTLEICTEMFTVNPTVIPVFINFLTLGTSSIDIKVHANLIEYKKDGGAFFEQASNHSKKILKIDADIEPEEYSPSPKRMV